ncbi:MAG: hypothetical protein AAGE94_19935, partial [Acidobacteriota bacterium]
MPPILIASLRSAVLLGLLFLAVPTFGQGWSWERPRPAAGNGEACGEAPQEQTSVTEHSITLDGRPLDYTATAGT